MSLPILHTRAGGEADLLRLFEQARVRWAAHLAEEHVLDTGRAFANPAMPGVPDANQVRDAALPEGLSPAQALEQVDSYFASLGARCLHWAMNPAAPAQRTEPLAQELSSRGFQERRHDLLLLRRAAAPADQQQQGVKVIPARASFRHARQLFEEAAAESRRAPQTAEADMAHLDDPHWDSLLALKDGAAVAHVGVFAVGELGVIDSLYVSPAHRRRGLGRLMMRRALEICARSLFRHVLLSVDPGVQPAQALCRSFGFVRIGRTLDYLAPDSRP